MEYSENGIKIKRIIQDNFNVKNPRKLERVVKELEAVIRPIVERLQENMKHWENRADDLEDDATRYKDERDDLAKEVRSLEYSKMLDKMWKIFYTYR